MRSMGMGQTALRPPRLLCSKIANNLLLENVNKHTRFIVERVFVFLSEADPKLQADLERYPLSRLLMMRQSNFGLNLKKRGAHF
jgi:hypothetical protein